MNINDWVVVYYDELKNIVETLELNDMLLEEAESISEDNMPEESFSYEIISMDDYKEGSLSDYNYEDEDYEE